MPISKRASLGISGVYRECLSSCVHRWAFPLFTAFLILFVCVSDDVVSYFQLLLGSQNAEDDLHAHASFKDTMRPVPSCLEFHSFGDGKTVQVRHQNLVYHSGKVLVVRHGNLHSLVFLQDSDDGSCAEESLVECSNRKVALAGASNMSSTCKHACNARAKLRLSVFRSMISGALYSRDAKISRALMLGLGAGAIPIWFSEQMPSTDFFAVDMNGDVVRAAPCFGLLESPSMHLIENDGLAYLAKQANGSFDVIFVDVFDGEHVPASFISANFFRVIRRVLSAEGVLVMDMYRKDVKGTLAVASDVFPSDTIFIGKSPGLQNTILLAGGLPQDRRTRMLVNLHGMASWLAQAEFHLPADQE